MKMTGIILLGLAITFAVAVPTSATGLETFEHNGGMIAAGTFIDHSVTGQVALTCEDIADPGFLLGQNPHDLADPDLDIMSSCVTTWATYLVAETVDQAIGPDWFDINSLTVWGLSLVNAGGIQNCDPTGMTFEVIFYEDIAGQPGTVICPPQSAVPFITPTGGLINGVFDVFQFDLPAVCDLGSIGQKWFTIQSESYAADCCFIWLSGTGGDGNSLQDGGSGWDPKDNDRSVCINGSPIPVELLSFQIE